MIDYLQAHMNKGRNPNASLYLNKMFVEGRKKNLADRLEISHKDLIQGEPELFSWFWG